MGWTWQLVEVGSNRYAELGLAQIIILSQKYDDFKNIKKRVRNWLFPPGVGLHVINDAVRMHGSPFISNTKSKIFSQKEHNKIKNTYMLISDL